MNDDRLRLDLASLADEVTPVDLRDRALRTSRRLGIQRAVATTAAAFVLVGAATGTAFAIRPDATAPTPLPADSPSIVDTTPPAPPAPPTPSVAPSTPTPPAAPTATIGRLQYGPGPGTLGEGSSPTAHLYSWQPGSGPKQLLAIPREVAVLNAAVSPDGRRVAWVVEDALWVSDVDGSGKRKLRDGVDRHCWTPAWSPDSRRLAIGTLTKTHPDDYRAGVIDVASGTFTESGELPGCHPVWSADGDFIAYADGSTGAVLLTRLDGPVRRAIPGLGSGSNYRSFDLASLSPDGGRIALHRRSPDMEAGDVARELDANVVLDTRTGKEVRLPLGGRELRQVYFQADGTLVARVKSGGGFAVVLVDAEGRKISESAEPAALKDMQILGVAG
ncbi:hypothetical protein [Micromonospora sp. WMMD812]|uniref:hypothetical protein n=1 Tax=Micromonospora sp. WMMD812 TaxID=3015152 RepID=UPI00248CE615|nr:hypothetical protein [Micromonospora sp. WMMD812]WBB65731.1 hypothetical protein O7603_21340 [Micromonospora sp. WMMD812]